MNAAMRVPALAALLALLALPAHAADPVFPTGSRVGLVPPGNMMPSKTFEGFGDPDKNAAILVSSLPPDAYEPLEKAGVPEQLRKDGFTIDKHDPIAVKDAKSFLISGTETADKTRYRKWLLVAAFADVTALVSVQVPEDEQIYSDKAMRAALATLTVRASVPDAERLSLLPFTIGDLAGFKISDVMAGRAVMLIDARQGTDNDAGFTLNARLLIAVLDSGPMEQNQWPDVARTSFGSIVGIKDVHIQVSEPLRINGRPGYQIVAQAKDINTGTDLMVAQWLRYTGGGFLDMVGMGRAEKWNEEFPRLRAIRDSIEPK
jgi:hypothetical protein